MKVEVPIPLPNKANTYEVHFNSVFWKQVQGVVFGLKKYIHGPLYWIGPTKEVKEAELAIAFIAKQSLPEDTLGPVRLDIWISDVMDADAVKAVLDGVEMSGRIKNDKQIKELHVYKLKMKNSKFWFDLTLLEEVRNEQPYPPASCQGKLS